MLVYVCVAGLTFSKNAEPVASLCGGTSAKWCTNAEPRGGENVPRALKCTAQAFVYCQSPTRSTRTLPFKLSSSASKSALLRVYSAMLSKSWHGTTTTD